MDFWEAYSILRARHCLRPEDVSVGAEVSNHTVKAWDLMAKNPEDSHARNPSHFNRVRLARLAEAKGAPKKVVEALKPVSAEEVRA